MRPGETTPRLSPSENGAPAQLPVLPAVPDAGGSDLPPGLTNPPGVDSLMATMRRRWQLILLFGIGGALLAFFAVWQLVPGRFASVLILGIRPGTEHEGEFTIYSRTQQNLLKSTPILQTLLQRSAIAELREVQEHGTDPAWLRTALVIDQPIGAGPETIRVTLQGEYPDDIATILNELADVYVKFQVAETRTLANSRAQQVSNDLADVKTQIAAKQKEISEMEGKLGLGDKINVENEISRLQTQIHDFSLEKRRLQRQQRELQDDIDKLDQQLKNPSTVEVPIADIEEALRNLPGQAAIVEQIAKVDAEIKRVSTIAANPAQATRKLLEEKSSLETKLASARPTAEYNARVKYLSSLKIKLTLAQDSVERTKGHIRDTQSDLTGVEQKLTQLRGGNNPELKNKLLAAQSDQLSLEKTREGLEERLRKAKEEAVAVSRISVVEPAQIPKERTTDRKWKYGGAAAVSAFALAFLAVAFIDFRLRRVNSVKDITQGLGLPVVGTLPLVPNRDARQLLMLDDSEANREQLALREAVDGVRTVVLHSARQHPLQVLLVTSALNGEGKTTLASQLATSLARSGRRTLLLDCDLRNASCAELLNRAGVPGVCEVMRGEVPIEDAIQNTEQELLFLVPGGQVDKKALQALSQDLPKNLFTILREHFEYIVVDTSPVLPVSDTLQLAPFADGILMAIMEQSSELPAVHQALQKLATLDIRVLGAVVGGTQQQIYLYGSNGRATQKTREG